VEPFFQIAYALVMFAAGVLVGLLPAFALGLFVPRADRRLVVLSGVALAVAGWIWAGWLGDLYGISRAGLVVFAGVGAGGFVYGWAAGLRAAGRARGRCLRRSSSPR
jgi:hypothetical protein